MFLLVETVILLGIAAILISCRKRFLLQSRWFHQPKKTSEHFEDARKASVDLAGIAQEEPYQFPPLKSGASPHMTMGLRKLKRGNWLTIDDKYVSEHVIRSGQLSLARSSVIQCLPGSESACHEVLYVVSSFLVARYPMMFVFTGVGSKQLIYNLQTGEKFPVVNNPQPLETAARLAMEDFNVLMKDPINGEYRLQASATLFPAGWRLEERIGFTLTELHCPVPGWQGKLGSPVTRYLDHLSPTTAMERHTLFVQTNPDLFQDESLCSSRKGLSVVTGLDLNLIGQDAPTTDTPIRDSPPSKVLSASDIHIRRERQTFVRLPVTNAVLFTVRTFMRPMTSLGDEELAAVIDIAGRWSDELAAYKGREKWWDTVVQYQKRKTDLSPEMQKS